LDTEKIVADLKNERDRLDRAIAALEETAFRPSPSKSRALTKPWAASETQASTNLKAVVNTGVKVRQYTGAKMHQ
jgi:hypothetical protein